MNLTELIAKQANMFGEATTGEDFTGTGNLDGDQTGFELRARRWYVSSAKWGKVYRIVGKDGIADSSYAEQLAEFMETCITNGYIGYETGNGSRNALLYGLLRENVNFNPNNILFNVECDCSSLTYAALRAVTGVVYDETERLADSPFTASTVSPRVRNLDSYIERQLAEAGFMIEVYTTPTNLSASPVRYCSTVYDTENVPGTVVVSIDEANAAYLTSGGLLRRGDIVRTVVPHTYGHCAVWL